MRWKFKMALEKAKLNQIRLARLTGLSEATISRIVCGYRNPNQDEKIRIAKALEVMPEKIWSKCSDRKDTFFSSAETKANWNAGTQSS